MNDPAYYGIRNSKYYAIIEFQPKTGSFVRVYDIYNHKMLAVETCKKLNADNPNQNYEVHTPNN